ncbi:MAG: hypothetical protein K5871_08840 [Lachnospiraceae bacterium]|nr:hypothetical protein [Lachnospiraceae bacterium]
MSENSTGPVSVKCRICGGELTSDYLVGECRCENCGNRWNLADLIPDYKNYTRIIEKINRAGEMLKSADTPAEATQAYLMYKSASAECLNHSGVVPADLLNMCKEGEEQASCAQHYLSAAKYMEKGQHAKALSELEKAKGIRDTAVLIEECRVRALEEKKKRIPYAIFIGLVIPLIVSIVLKEKAGLPVIACIPVFIIGSVLLAYAVYLEGVLSIIIEILSFMSAVPLILFLILAYGFHLGAGLAATISVGIPLGILAVLVILSEVKLN